MATKQRADTQKEKEKKEKIILAALVGVLVIVGAFELPKLLKSSSPAASSTVQTTSSSPGVTTSGVALSGPVAVSSLPNASAYKADSGQLNGFSLFNGGDPFGKVATSSGSTTPSTTPTGKTHTTTATITQNAYPAARISVNGTSQDVLIGETFPSTSAVFVLNSVTAKQIKISVSGGSFSSGQAKVTIKRGKSVALVNTVDSFRYVVKYVAPLTHGPTSTTTGGTTASSTPVISTTGTTGTTGTTP
jgi:ribosomal protein S9